MTSLSIFGGLLIFVICIAIIAIRVYQNNKNQQITMNDIIDVYGDNIVNILKDVVEVMQIDMYTFATKEAYEEEIVYTTIKKIKENYTEFGIDCVLLDYVDINTLTNIIMTIMKNNKFDIFSCLTKESILENEEILDDEIVSLVNTETQDSEDINPELNN